MLFIAILETLTGINLPPHQHIYEHNYKYIRRVKNWERKRYRTTVWKMQKRGLVTITEENGKKFIQCTRAGQIYFLFEKAVLPHKGPWDGQWRLISFDIPESSKEKRNSIRYLLKKNRFVKFQDSIYISPFPMNREAIEYLKMTSLKDYIRFIRAVEIDDDTDLRRKFQI